MTITVVSSPTPSLTLRGGAVTREIKERIMEVKKMEPRIEDYLDSTCVASTGGDGGPIRMAL